MATITSSIGTLAGTGTGSISGTTLTITVQLTGSFGVGQTITGTGVTAGTHITVDQGGGVFTVDISQTVVTTTITGGRDFSTPQSWANSIPATPTSAFVGLDYQEGPGTNGEWVQATVILSISNITTSSTNTITYKPAPGKGFKDQSGATSNPLRYDASKGVAFRTTNNYDATITVVGTDWVFIDGMQVSNASGANQAIMLNSLGQTNCLISNTIAEGVGSDAVINARTCRLVNPLIILRRATAGSAIKAPYNGTMAWTGVTMVRPSNFAAGGNAIQLNSSTTTLKNSMSFGFAAVSNVNMAAGSSNNCADIAIPFGTSNQASKTYANQFVTTTDTGRDFRLKAGSDALDNGLTDTTNNPNANDIYGTSRPQGTAWDIGANELVAASGGMSGTIAGIGSVSAALTGSGALVTSISGAGSIAAALTGTGVLSTNIAGQASVTANLTGSSGSNLSASIAGQASVSGTLTATGALAAQINGQASVSLNNNQASGASSGITRLQAIEFYTKLLEEKEAKEKQVIVQPKIKRKKKIIEIEEDEEESLPIFVHAPIKIQQPDIRAMVADIMRNVPVVTPYSMPKRVKTQRQSYDEEAILLLL